MVRGNFDPNTWYFPVSITVPFDESTIFGWYMKFFMYEYGSLMYFLGITSIVTFLMGCCFYIEAFTKDMQMRFDTIDAELEKVKSGKKINEKRINSQMAEVVAFHMEIVK